MGAVRWVVVCNDIATLYRLSAYAAIAEKNCLQFPIGCVAASPQSIAPSVDKHSVAGFELWFKSLTIHYEYGESHGTKAYHCYDGYRKCQQELKPAFHLSIF